MIKWMQTCLTHRLKGVYVSVWDAVCSQYLKRLYYVGPLSFCPYSKAANPAHKTQILGRFDIRFNLIWIFFSDFLFFYKQLYICLIENDLRLIFKDIRGITSLTI